MPRFQNKPSLADVARRRGQSILDVLKDWGIDVDFTDDEFDAALQRRCTKEGVRYSKVERAQKPTLKNALVELPKQESATTVGKKTRKSKVTLDESVASDEHVGVDPSTPSGPKNPT